ncbi:alpha/beta-hydrolase [Stipitochalara longipes BDJ]|nr:alpha/beta-hydrolase [Stipitochalara longipes BDJ]
MMRIMNIFVFILLCVGVTISSPLENRQIIPSGCTNITILVDASFSGNIPLPFNLDSANFLLLVNSLLSGVFDGVASGTYNIAATYCPPVGIPARENTLQILIHGGTYTKGYWFGEYYSQENSWVTYASSKGYATLTIDRLGNGNSSHPNPITTVQLPYQAEQLHEIIAMARGGTLPLPVPGTSFDKIIVVGHSLGSVVANNLNANYPSDADATILTGYAYFFPPQFTGVFAESWILPAELDPRFATLPVGYLEINNKDDFSFLFYDPGQFSQALQDVDFATRGTITLGEAASVMIGSLQTEYTGPVLVVTGQHDSIYCSEFTIDLQILLGTPTCDMSSSGIVAKAKTLYPLAKDFQIVWPDAGHCWQLHDNASYTFGIAHDWLADQGF